jgi:ligand-binding sensor domain-containing protein
MANATFIYFNYLIIKALSIRKSVRNFCQFIGCVYQLLLSIHSRGFLGPLSITLIFSLFLGQNAALAQTQMTLPTAEKPIDIIEFQRQIFLVTEHAVYVADKKEARKIFQSESGIKAAAATKTLLCVATGAGLFVTNSTIITDNTAFKKRQLPTDKTDFVALKTDPTSPQIWVATRDNGIYIVNDSTEKLMSKALFVNDIAVISPADYWIGTDAGLVHRVSGETIRYAEEGVAGFEIPDNIVEKLHIINGEKLVVQMSGPLSIFHLAGEKTSAHGVNLGFIGTKGNTIFDLKGLPDGAVLAATAAGLTHLPKHILADEHEHQGFHEIFSEADRHEATKLDLGSLGFKNLEKSTIVRKILLDSRQNLWLATDGQLLSVKSKKVGLLVK